MDTLTADAIRPKGRGVKCEALMLGRPDVHLEYRCSVNDSKDRHRCLVNSTDPDKRHLKMSLTGFV